MCVVRVYRCKGSQAAVLFCPRDRVSNACCCTPEYGKKSLKTPVNLSSPRLETTLYSYTTVPMSVLQTESQGVSCRLIEVEEGGGGGSSRRGRGGGGGAHSNACHG